MLKISPIILMLPLAGCAGASVTRTSGNSMMIDASAAPACGSNGAAKVASKYAAIETIRAGYDRYLITGGRAENNVVASQMPGTALTNANLNYGYGGGSYNSTTTYISGPTVYAGSHDRALSVLMLKKGDAGYENGVDARNELGSNWNEIVQSGIRTCL